MTPPKTTRRLGELFPAQPDSDRASEASVTPLPARPLAPAADDSDSLAGRLPDQVAVGPDPQPAPGDADLAASRQPPPGRRYVSKFERMDDKHVRMWPHQLDDLARLAKQLERRRPTGVGERLTENTLIRVAVDLLLDRQAELTGNTEDELKRALRIKPR